MAFYIQKYYYYASVLARSACSTYIHILYAIHVVLYTYILTIASTLLHTIGSTYTSYIYMLCSSTRTTQNTYMLYHISHHIYIQVSLFHALRAAKIKFVNP